MSPTRPRCRRRASLLFAAMASLGACRSAATELEDPTAREANGSKPTIVPAPEDLRGRVALPAGARLYTHPNYSSPSYALELPDPPLDAAGAPPRTRAFRVIGVVRSLDDALAGIEGTPAEFIAVTNDLDAEDPDPPRGCGPRFGDLDHLRTLMFVPRVHLALVTTRGLELAPLSRAGEDERMEVGAGVRVGPAQPRAGFPPPPEGAHFHWIDADGIRVIAPIPDDAIGLAWDPHDAPSVRPRGEQLLRDAEGSSLWLDDEGGATVVLAVHNDCGFHRRVVEDPAEVESLRALALDLFYDQHPPAEDDAVIQDAADYLIPAGTPLRWTDGELAGEVLRDWGVNVGVGQTWTGRRCFPLILSGELPPLDQPAFACVDPDQLEPLNFGGGGGGFALEADLELGGSIELGPPEVIMGPWSDDELRPVLNRAHASTAECLRPLLDLPEDGLPAPSQWLLELIVLSNGAVDRVELTALGPTHPAVEDCLRAEAYTWLMPDGGGQVVIPVTLGPWGAVNEDDSGDDPAAPNEPGPDEAPAAEPADRERGKVIIIRDDDYEEDAG